MRLAGKIIVLFVALGFALSAVLWFVLATQTAKQEEKVGQSLKPITSGDTFEYDGNTQLTIYGNDENSGVRITEYCTVEGADGERRPWDTDEERRIIYDHLGWYYAGKLELRTAGEYKLLCHGYMESKTLTLGEHPDFKPTMDSGSWRILGLLVAVFNAILLVPGMFLWVAGGKKAKTRPQGVGQPVGHPVQMPAGQVARQQQPMQQPVQQPAPQQQPLSQQPVQQPAPQQQSPQQQPAEHKRQPVQPEPYNPRRPTHTHNPRGPQTQPHNPRGPQA